MKIDNQSFICIIFCDSCGSFVTKKNKIADISTLKFEAKVVRKERTLYNLSKKTSEESRNESEENAESQL
ncbi:hypothetical protein T4B_11780 [Trichinella pseudospiralis]|uniref:Uncharacterized protein n=1 Tax=Trichinella pseudospiralis TaxID=6337 RepID=A0A0V1JP03_TRIPS|nr:hypothetical protein T4A_12638 [Trichinella pseudospiralis]KRZ11656.1 hypothetical protein T4B_11780 [Trichinella pseudospiralis]KRZ36714.1 hypothetical protein T4C_7928 [Trichinella pseudospiralis]